MAEAARYEGKPYDLILMDVRMPVMDGLEATEQLRALENPSPIIGVTANIMHEDHETYFKLGMVDCLAKPFLAQDLWAMLRGYLPEADPLPNTAAPTPSLPVTQEAPPESAKSASGENTAIDRTLGLQKAAGDAERYRRNLQDFVVSHHDAAKALKDLLRAGDTARVRAIAHGMKGAAGMIGAVGLAEAATRLEEALARSPRLQNDSEVHNFEIALNAVLGDIAGTDGEGDKAKPAGNAHHEP